MKYKTLLLTAAALFVCSAASAATIECREVISWRALSCGVVEAEHNRGRAPEHAATNTPSEHPHDGPTPPHGPSGPPTTHDKPGVGPDPVNPTDPSDPTDPTDPGCTGVCGGPDDPSRHRNNGWGNGDQDAPGNSLNHNNAENNHSGKTDPSHGKKK